MPPIDLVRIEQENSAGVDRKMQSGILHNIIESASRHIEGQIRVYTFCGVGEEYARSIDLCSVLSKTLFLSHEEVQTQER